MKHKAVTQRILAWMLALALLFTGILPANTASLTVNAANTTKSSNEITTAEEFPTKIPAGETYTLTADIKLADGQQITDLAGTLDGQGHVITLSGKVLAENVSGTIQNLGVAGSVDVESDDKGSITDNLTGTIQNSYSTVTINDEGMFEEVGGIVGVLDGGSILNCYYAGTSSSLMLDGIAAYNKSANSVINNSYYTSKAASAIGKQYGDNKAQVTNCASKSVDELKTADTVALLNTGIVDTGYIFAVSEDGGFPVLVKGAAEISWTPLENALKQAEGYEEENYTEESWKNTFRCSSSRKCFKSRRRGDTGADHSGSKGDHRCDRSTEKQTDDKTGGTAGECDLHLFPGRFFQDGECKRQIFRPDTGHHGKQ